MAARADWGSLHNRLKDYVGSFLSLSDLRNLLVTNHDMKRILQASLTERGALELLFSAVALGLPEKMVEAMRGQRPAIILKQIPYAEGYYTRRASGPVGALGYYTRRASGPVGALRHGSQTVRYEFVPVRFHKSISALQLALYCMDDDMARRLLSFIEGDKALQLRAGQQAQEVLDRIDVQASVGCTSVEATAVDSALEIKRRAEDRKDTKEVVEGVSAGTAAVSGARSADVVEVSPKPQERKAMAECSEPLYQGVLQAVIQAYREYHVSLLEFRIPRPDLTPVPENLRAGVFNQAKATAGYRVRDGNGLLLSTYEDGFTMTLQSKYGLSDEQCAILKARCAAIREAHKNLPYCIKQEFANPIPFGPTPPTFTVAPPRMGYVDIETSGLEGGLYQNFQNLICRTSYTILTKNFNRCPSLAFGVNSLGSHWVLGWVEYDMAAMIKLGEVRMHQLKELIKVLNLGAESHAVPTDVGKDVKPKLR